jgi:hypothetical protein
MENAKHNAAHDSAAEILKNAEAQDRGLSYMLYTTHEDSETTTRSVAASEKDILQFLQHIEPRLLAKALEIQLAK